MHGTRDPSQLISALGVVQRLEKKRSDNNSGSPSYYTIYESKDTMMGER